MAAADLTSSVVRVEPLDDDAPSLNDCIWWCCVRCVIELWNFYFLVEECFSVFWLLFVLSQIFTFKGIFEDVNIKLLSNFSFYYISKFTMNTFR